MINRTDMNLLAMYNCSSLQKYKNTENHKRNKNEAVIFYKTYFTPSFFSITDIKHQFVKPDCNKLAPTKTVNQIQFGCT